MLLYVNTIKYVYIYNYIYIHYIYIYIRMYVCMHVCIYVCVENTFSLKPAEQLIHMVEPTKNGNQAKCGETNACVHKRKVSKSHTTKNVALAKEEMGKI